MKDRVKEVWSILACVCVPSVCRYITRTLLLIHFSRDLCSSSLVLLFWWRMKSVSLFLLILPFHFSIMIWWKPPTKRFCLFYAFALWNHFMVQWCITPMKWKKWPSERKCYNGNHESFAPHWVRTELVDSSTNLTAIAKMCDVSRARAQRDDNYNEMHFLVSYVKWISTLQYVKVAVLLCMTWS